MYLDVTIPYPDDDPKFTLKNLPPHTYVYYEVGRDYNPVKQHTIPRRVTVGKIDGKDASLMIPNEKYVELFGRDALPQDSFTITRSTTLSVGTYIVIKKIISDYRLNEILTTAIRDERNRGVFIDFAAYELITSSNAAQHFGSFAYRHPTFSPGMRIYSDTVIGEVFEEITCDERQVFLDEWNKDKDKSKIIYVSYDSTSRHTKAGDIEEAEFGKPKDGQTDVPIINQGQAYDTDNRVPLFYESYPGSINDVSMLQYLVEKCIAYGYLMLCFILDRGDFSRENLFYMDSKNYHFLIMAKGNAKFIRSLVESAMGTFELERKFLIKKFLTQGTTIVRKLFPDDPRDKLRYVHVYFNDVQASIERRNLERSIFKWEKALSKCIGKQVKKGLGGFAAYFDLKYDEDGKLLSFETRDDVIEEEKFWAGYFAIVSSMEMTAETALLRYKGRDCSEKTFLGDKSFLGNNTYRVDSDEAKDTKEWIGFFGEIIQNKIYTDLIDAEELDGSKSNYMSVPAAIAELEKYEISRQGNGKYHIDHPLTKQQRKIMEALHLDKDEVKNEAQKICDQINELIKQAKEKEDKKEKEQAS